MAKCWFEVAIVSFGNLRFFSRDGAVEQTSDCLMMLATATTTDARRFQTLISVGVPCGNCSRPSERRRSGIEFAVCHFSSAVPDPSSISY